MSGGIKRHRFVVSFEKENVRRSAKIVAIGVAVLLRGQNDYSDVTCINAFYYELN